MKIGFIGLGIMGKPMVRNLLKAGYEVQAYDIVEASVKAVAESGAIGCASIAEAVRGCPIVITMLPNSPHVKAAVLGEGGVLENAERNALLVDMSSIAPGASIEIHDALSKKGIRMIDAPVSGGEPKAIDGTMAIMIGGDEADFEEALPLFRVMGGSYTLVGPIGSGNTCKLTNQIIVAVNIAALAEGMMLARRAGTDPEKVFEAIRGGLAGSTVMNAKAPMMLANDFPPGFRIDLHIKDLNNALETGEKFDSPLPLTEMVQSAFRELSGNGDGSLDHSALLKYYSARTGVKLKEEE